jgi:hypothetical protein
MKQSLKYFLSGLSIVLLVMLVLFLDISYGNLVLPFESVGAEIGFFSLLFLAGTYLFSQGLWLMIQKEIE